MHCLASHAPSPHTIGSPFNLFVQVAAGSVAAYLHESLHHFVDASAIEDMAGCLDYLSASDCIARGFRYGELVRGQTWLSSLHYLTA